MWFIFCKEIIGISRISCIKYLKINFNKIEHYLKNSFKTIFAFSSVVFLIKSDYD